ncbi:hypothetical protein [Brachyspira pilosicoli]|uniref:hypothetical protein n=1 Tax=Brachyspira pilosicoli TaxID=52584 RepID=UPI0012F6B2FD|nr:hypothetical protein [Brachyspira pilosicoli]
MQKNKKLFFYLSLITLLLSFSLTIFNRVYSFKRAGAPYDDFMSHFYDMKRYHEKNVVPVTGARFVMKALNDESAPRVPGGFFYIHYLLAYKLANENIMLMRLFHLISMLIPVLIFLFWVYRKCGLSISAIMSVFTLFNIYYIYSSNLFSNPHLTLGLSFLLVPILGEYISDNKNTSPAAAMMFFPILALMAQGHFAVYYGIVPTVILYLIIRYKMTIKYIKYILIGVFISFLTYFPYLVSEIKNGFENTNKMIELASNATRHVFPFPQIHVLLVFPTNEFSVAYYAKYFNNIMSFYLNDNPYYIYTLIILVLSIIIVFSALIYDIIKFFKNKEWKFNFKEKVTNDIVIKEVFFIFLLYFPATVFTTIFGGGVAGQLRYQYGGFGLSFFPMVYFLYNLQLNSKYNILSGISIFSILSSIAMTFNIMIFYQKYHEPYRWTDYIDTVYNIIDDSKGEKFIIDNSSDYFNNMGISYNKRNSWNLVSSNANIIYYLDVPDIAIKYPHIFDRNAILSKKYSRKEIESMNLKMVSSNSTCIVYRR